MVHVRNCDVKNNSESVFRYFASAVNEIEKIFMLSVVYSSLKKLSYVPLYTFHKSLFDIQLLGF